MSSSVTQDNVHNLEHPSAGPHVQPADDSEKFGAGEPDARVRTADEPPNGGYGWVCVACCFWVNAHTWGINSASSSIGLDY